MTNEQITNTAFMFHVATFHGNSIQVFTDEEFLAGALPSNVAWWAHIEVHTEQEQAQWVDAYQQWLEAAYAPTQARETSEQYEETYARRRIMRTCENTMKLIEAREANAS